MVEERVKSFECKKERKIVKRKVREEKKSEAV
jgi:hypothetical protein